MCTFPRLCRTMKRDVFFYAPVFYNKKFTAEGTESTGEIERKNSMPLCVLYGKKLITRAQRKNLCSCITLFDGLVEFPICPFFSEYFIEDFISPKSGSEVQRTIDGILDAVGKFAVCY